MSESLFGIHGAALELRSQRMGLLTSNIANASTPGYKARDIDFATALNARMAGADSEQASEAATLYRVPVMPSLDGNTVELQNEQLAASRSASKVDLAAAAEEGAAKAEVPPPRDLPAISP